MREVRKIEVLDNYKLLLKFDNDESKIYDMSEMLDGVFEHLKDYNRFKSVEIINGAPTWFLNGVLVDDVCSEIDICPDSVYLDSVSCEGIIAWNW